MRKPKNMRAMDFGSSREPLVDFSNYEKIIKDRGSVYSVSIAKVTDRDSIQNFLSNTKKIKGHHKATHHSWAARISKEGVVYETKNDDGETGAGNVVLRILQKREFINIAVCVTRWYGGVKLMADRFKHVQDATIYAVDNV